MATSKARKLVTVVRPGPRPRIGPVTADTATPMNFARTSPSRSQRSFNPDASRKHKSPNVPEHQEPE